MLVPGGLMRVAGVEHSSVADQVVEIIKLHPDMIHWIFKMAHDESVNPERYALPTENLICLNAEQSKKEDEMNTAVESLPVAVPLAPQEENSFHKTKPAPGGGPVPGHQMRLIGVAEHQPGAENSLVNVIERHTDGVHWVS